MSPPPPSPALTRLEVLVGTWAVGTPHSPEQPGRATVE
jgi:hypothetical protein